ncbi:MAG: ribokinase [Asticcacaulis sp.]|nr:ribokinase [Asticcacaulis sp.]
MSRPIVVVGSLNFDTFLDVAALPKPNETLIGRGMRTAIGGKGLNQAVACARFGRPVEMVGAVGNDAAGQAALAHLEAHGVSTAHIKILTDAPTGMAHIVVAQDGQNTIVVTSGANACVSPADIDTVEVLIAGAAALVVQLEIPLAAVARALELARRHGVLTVVNPAPAHTGVLDLLGLADIITPNELELMALTGIADLTDASLAEGLRRLEAGGGRALVTLGAAGCATLVGGALLRMPAFPVIAVDATGAGDTFTGALVDRLAAGETLHDAMHYASAAAAISVTRASADSAPSPDEVAAFLVQHQA